MMAAAEFHSIGLAGGRCSSRLARKRHRDKVAALLWLVDRHQSLSRARQKEEPPGHSKQTTTANTHRCSESVLGNTRPMRPAGRGKDFFDSRKAK